MKKGEIDRKCNLQSGEQNTYVYTAVVGNPERTKLRRRYEDNIKMEIVRKLSTMVLTGFMLFKIATSDGLL
jgi:hypothetical protein